MVTITNGVHTMVVSNGAYRSIFANQGYRPVEEQEVKSKLDDTPSHVSEDDLFVSELNEKPLSQWNKEELKRYAAINNIDISGTRNPNEAKQIVKEYMQEHSKS